MSQCSAAGCSNEAHPKKNGECYKHAVAGIGITFHGGVRPGRTSWNRSKTEWMMEHLGTTDDRELGKRGIERAPS